jgi:hypothetical protein
METEEQRKQRLELTQARYEEMYREENYREMASNWKELMNYRDIKRAANKAPTVSDKIRRLPNK